MFKLVIVTGVSLLAQNALPLVASGAIGYSLKTETAINAPAALRSDTLNTRSSLALHLNLTIGEYIEVQCYCIPDT